MEKKNWSVWNVWSNMENTNDVGFYLYRIKRENRYISLNLLAELGKKHHPNLVILRLWDALARHKKKNIKGGSSFKLWNHYIFCYCAEKEVWLISMKDYLNREKDWWRK